MKTLYKSLNTAVFFDKIRIPQAFKDNPPTPEKLIHKTLAFVRDSELSTIVVDGDMKLLDGYCSYLIAKETDIRFAKIKQAKAVK